MIGERVHLPAWRVRLAGRGPQLALYVAALVLSVAGLRSIATGDAGIAPVRIASEGDLAAQALAQAFARSYLSWDVGDAAAREAALARFTSSSLDPGGGMELPESGSQAVSWTAAVADRRISARRRIVTVAAQTSARGLLYLAVPVARDKRGSIAVGGYPALVGAPAIDPGIEAPDEQEVRDERLVAVARRAVGNYLAAERQNLLADLDPRASVSLPGLRLRLRSVEGTSWAGPRRVAVQVQAEDASGAGWTLRYELSVVRRERWYVREIHTDPTNKRRNR